ncbi:MAG: YicC family protein [Methylococcaceae bacterium]|nr:YicC family protein [Methylococcaceae bacterium]
MIRSMTAFAGSEAEIDATVYAWEIRSVNHRYLDVNIRIPDHLRTLETGFRSLITQQLKRGKIDCSLNCQRESGSSNDIHIDRHRLTALIRVMREIESEIHDASPCSALEIMQWPGIIVERKVDPDALKDAIENLLRIAVSRIIECREREGARLADVIADRCQRFKEQVRSVRLRLPAIAEKLRLRLHSKLEEISAEVDPLRFEQEIVFLLQKMDVDEELERLTTHIVEVERVLENEDIAGRRLDFLLQELNREANTLGSKSLDRETTQACVEMKVLIEQMREQVQNIE